MAQDNELKRPVFMATPENAGGSESGETTLIPGTGENTPAQNPSYLNGTYSTEDKAAKYEYPNVHQDVPDAGQNQYQ